MSPNPFESAYEIIRMLDKYNKKFVLCTHAQDDWTKVKVSLLGKEIEKQISYLTVDINKKKGADSWKEATKLIDTDIQKTLVVGDNLEADIFPAIEAGCKYIIWMDRYEEGIPSDIYIPENMEIEIIVIKDLSNIRNL